MSDLKKNDIYTVKIEGCASGGEGVARIDGRAVFVRGAIMGEECEIRSGAVIGGTFREGEKREISVIGKKHVIESNQVVKPGEVI